MHGLWRWGCKGVLNFCWSRPKQDETGNQDKLTLNSSTSSSCKQEAWRLKRDLETSSRVREQEVETRLCRGHATTNKQKMTGDGRTPDIGHLPISTWRVCVLALCIHTHYNNNACVMHKHLSYVISCKNTMFLSSCECLLWFVVWQECLQGAVMHHSSDRLWSTNTNWVIRTTHCSWHQFYLQFQSIHVLCPRVVTFQGRNAIQTPRESHELDKEVNENWLNQTLSACLILQVKDPGWPVEVWCCGSLFANICSLFNLKI